MIERIRRWPWRYIGRRAVVSMAFIAGFAPFLSGCAALNAAWVIAAGVTGASANRVGDWFVVWIAIPEKLLAWADQALPAPSLLEELNASIQALNALLMGSLSSLSAQPVDVPDDPSPAFIRGWREYQIEEVGAILYGAAHGRWEGAEMAAQCQALPARQHLLDGTCSCGIYILKEKPSQIQRPWKVWAEVVGWGAYIEYERGWRCEHVRIERLRIPDTAWLLGQRYGCPVDLVREG